MEHRNQHGFITEIGATGVVKNVAFKNAVIGKENSLVSGMNNGLIENVYVHYAAFGSYSAATNTSTGKASLADYFSAGNTGPYTATFNGANTNATGTVRNVFVDLTGVQAGIEGTTWLDDPDHLYPLGKQSSANTKYFGVYAIGTHADVSPVYAISEPTDTCSWYVDETGFNADLVNNTNIAKEVYSWPTWLQELVLGEEVQEPTVDVEEGYFVKNSATEYVLVVGEGKTEDSYYTTVEEISIRMAVDLLVEQVKLATGATITIEFAPKAWDSTKKMIVLGDWNLFDNGAQLSLENGDYGVIRSGNSVFLMAENANDYQLAVIKFLEEVLGYRAYAADSVGSNKTAVGAYTDENQNTITYIQDAEFNGFIEYLNVENNGVKMPTSINFTNASMFNYRQSGPFSLTSEEQSYVMGSREYNDYIYGQWHNTFEFVDPTQSYTVNGTTYRTYESEKKMLGAYSNHPWYSTGAKGNNYSNYYKTEDNNGTPYQLCYTAHGNTTAYAALVQLVGEEMIKRANANPDYDIFSFTQQDNHWACACDTCTSNGKMPSDTILAFIDDVLTYVNVTNKAALTRPEIKIAYFAYTAYFAAPTSYKYSETQPLNPNTYLVLAPIRSSYDEVMNTGDNTTSNSWTNTANAAWNADWNDMAAWLSKSAASGVQIYLWMYELNQYDWFSTRNSFKANIGNIRLFAQYDNIDLIQIENLWHQANTSAFGQLKAYMNAEAMKEVNYHVPVVNGKVDETELEKYYTTLVNEFFGRNADNGKFSTTTGYYGPANEAMYTLYQAMQAAYTYFNGKTDLDGNTIDVGKPSYTRLWKWNSFDSSIASTNATYKFSNWATLLNNAYTAINNASLTDEQKAAYLERVKIESMTYRWIVACQEQTYTVPFSLMGVSYADIKAFRTAFLEDAKAFGYVYYASGTAATLYSLEYDWFKSNTIYKTAPTTSY